MIKQFVEDETYTALETFKDNIACSNDCCNCVYEYSYGGFEYGCPKELFKVLLKDIHDKLNALDEHTYED